MIGEIFIAFRVHDSNFRATNAIILNSILSTVPRGAVIFAANLFNFETLVPLAVFGAFAAMAWWVLERIAAGNPRAIERLARIEIAPRPPQCPGRKRLEKIRSGHKNAGDGHSRFGQTPATEKRNGTRQAQGQIVLRRIPRRIGGKYLSWV